MTPRYALVGFACVPLGALLAAACSSSEDARSPDVNGDAAALDAGTATPDGDTTVDAGHEAGNVEPPPPYDFAVKCASEPCVTRIAASGGGHACAILQDGSVRCWGSNDSGQLGTGAKDGGPLSKYEAAPQRVLGITNAKSVAAAGNGPSGTTCVVSDTGSVACFGSDGTGQLGRGSDTSSGPNPDPVVLEGFQATSVMLTPTFALAVGTDDRLWSWGANDAYQLARTASDPDAGALSAPARADRIADSVRSYAGTSNNGFVVAANGNVLSWGGSTADQLGRATSLTLDPIPNEVAVSDVSSITASATHACALSRGSVYCWGQNEYGQLGTARRATESSPARVLFPEDDTYAVAVAAGGDNTCAIASDGKVHCWGANGSGQTGDATGRDRTTPALVEGLDEQAVAIAVMDASICALLRSGTVRCWGDNLFGQLGRGARDANSHAESAPVVFK